METHLLINYYNTQAVYRQTTVDIKDVKLLGEGDIYLTKEHLFIAASSIINPRLVG